MAKFNYNGPEEFEPLGAWHYFWLNVLYAIPLIGFIFLLVHCFSRSNINRRSYARSHFCGFVFILIFWGVLVVGILITGGIATLTTEASTIWQSIVTWFQSMVEKVKSLFAA